MATSLGIGTQDALSSSSDQEAQILNPAILRSTRSFSKFNNLPPEVRDKIWIHSLAHERILKIYSAECRVEVRERVAMSKLFVTTLESRAAAKKFYRVHIPCKYVHMTSTYDGILYFNPELDIVHVFEWAYFLELANHTWKLDPLHVGVVNLALQTYGSCCEYYYFGRSFKTDCDLDKIKAAIRRLKRFIFVCHGVYESETCQYRENRRRPDRDIPSSPFVPVKPHVPAFQTMEHDPMAVGDFLDGVDRMELSRLRADVDDWFECLEEWGINNDPAVLYQIMMSYPDCDPEIIVNENACWAHDVSDQLSDVSTPNSTLTKPVQAVYDRDDAIAFAENEIEERKRILDQLLEDESEVDDEEVDKLSRQDVAPAFGFWLFPLDALPVVKLTANSEMWIVDFDTELQEQFKKHTP
ncbi:hypothetical protein H9Q72_007740 [Fusarium xylarioides]|uniref:2EXR domain-containing protein n=1 Tax=Fusarium xylarioides TaxID=221167 RepID=A0A9P7HYH4_9HYPO|nr:hypothetical protein H9Q70_006343 [Fusarium xylarioides]KAG5764165.1 hypothetical protein H9Q72_007740 [Fusarium xylarioides]KAG5782401.1 hypothetical protein H9Q73_003959 [Fusarium xylarioides]